MPGTSLVAAAAAATAAALAASSSARRSSWRRRPRCTPAALVEVCAVVCPTSSPRAVLPSAASSPISASIVCHCSDARCWAAASSEVRCSSCARMRAVSSRASSRASMASSYADRSNIACISLCLRWHSAIVAERWCAASSSPRMRATSACSAVTSRRSAAASGFVSASDLGAALLAPSLLLSLAAAVCLGGTSVAVAKTRVVCSSCMAKAFSSRSARICPTASVMVADPFVFQRSDSTRRSIGRR